MIDGDVCAELVAMNKGWLPNEQTKRVGPPLVGYSGAVHGGTSRNE